MTATIIAIGNYPFGQMTNQLVAGLIASNTKLLRAHEAIATASAGYTGTEGTQFEVPATGVTVGTPPNLFGVVAVDPPGKAGSDYRYAMDGLKGAWDTFWTAAAPFLEQLDNGQTSM